MSDTPSVPQWAKERLFPVGSEVINGFVGRAAMFKVNGIEFFVLAKPEALDAVANLIFPDSFTMDPEHSGKAFISGMKGFLLEDRVPTKTPAKNGLANSATSSDENEPAEKIEAAPVSAQVLAAAAHVEHIQAQPLVAIAGPTAATFKDVDADKHYKEGQEAFRSEGHQAICPHTFTEAGCEADHWQSGFESARNEEL